MIEGNQGGKPDFAPMRKIDILTGIELITAALLSALVLSFLVVRATNAGALWRDEAATLQLSQMRAGEIFSNFQHEAFPPPFPFLIRAYTAVFGASDASLRWFGFTVGTMLIAAAWFNSRAFGDRGPLLVLTLFGLNATFLIWGTSVRGYGLGCVLLLLSLGLAAKAILRPTRSNAAAATLAGVASVQVMLNAVPLVAAIGASAFAVFVFQRRFREALITAGCTAICAISLLPYAGSYLGADWSVVLKYPATFLSLWEKFRLALEQPSNMAALFWYVLLPGILIGALSYVWFARGAETASDRGFLLFLALVSLLSIFAYFTFLKILSYATRPWYYLPLLCALAGAADLLSTTLSRVQSFRIVRLLVAVIALLLLPAPVWPHLRERLTNIDLVAHKLEQEAAPNDLIVLNPWHFAPSFYHYYHGSTPWITVPTMSEHRVHRYDLMKSKMLEANPLSDVRSAIQQTLQSKNRVWVVGGARPLDPDMPRLGPAPNPYFGWAGYMSFWSMEVGSFLSEHAVRGEVVLEPMPNINDGENVPLLVASGWQE